MKILDEVDPLKQMISLNVRKTFLLNKRLTLLEGIKCNEALEVKFDKLGSEERMIEKSFHFRSEAQVIMNEYEIETALLSMRSDIEKRIDRFTMEGSGWAVIGVLNHDLIVNKYDPLAAWGYIKLPDKIQNKKATINIKNEDDKCFIYCLGRALDPCPEKAHFENVSRHLKTVCESLGLNNIKTPVNVEDIQTIETQFNISINLSSHKNSDIYPIRVTRSVAEKHVDLLITSNAETNHYVLENSEDNTEKLQKHVAYSYGYKVVCCYDEKMSKPFKMCRGLNSVSKFFSDIFEEEQEILDKLRKFQTTPMNLSSDEKIHHKNAPICYVCKGKFTNENPKVRDHCHVNGNYRGAACNKCNLGMKLTKHSTSCFP